MASSENIIFQTDSINKITSAFGKEDMLEPLRQLVAIVKTSKIDSILVRSGKREAIQKDYFALITAVIPVMIAAIVTIISWDSR